MCVLLASAGYEFHRWLADVRQSACSSHQNAEPEGEAEAEIMDPRQSSPLIEAVVWIIAAIVIGCALAAGLVQLIAPRAHAAGAPYSVYRVPYGCIYVAGTTNPAMLFVPDDAIRHTTCDGAMRDGKKSNDGILLIDPVRVK